MSQQGASTLARRRISSAGACAWSEGRSVAVVVDLVVAALLSAPPWYWDLRELELRYAELQPRSSKQQSSATVKPSRAR